MLKVGALLLLSCLSVFGASPFWYCPTTNELVAIEIVGVNGRQVAWLSGLSATNQTSGGLFAYATNSTAALDGLNYFKPTNQNGRWERQLGIIPPARTITAGTGLTGGGDLSANRTITLANTAVTPNTYGSQNQVGQFTVDQQGRLTSAGNVAINNLSALVITVDELPVEFGGTGIDFTSAPAFSMPYYGGATFQAVLPNTTTTQKFFAMTGDGAAGGVPTWVAVAGTAGANPSATVGLTAVNGAAATFLRSDGAPALSQSIAPTWTGFHTHSFPSLGVTQDDAKGVLLVNTTDAAAGAQQISPAIRWLGEGWKTDATAESRTVAVRNWLLPVQGAANPSGTFKWQASINGGAYSDILTLSTAGLLTMPSASVSGNINALSAVGANAMVNSDASGNLQGIASVRGTMIQGGIVNWTTTAIGASGKFWRSDGTDGSWQNITPTDLGAIGSGTYTGTTSNATKTAIGTFTPTDNMVITITVTGHAIKSGGTAGSPLHFGDWTALATFEKVSGTVTQLSQGFNFNAGDYAPNPPTIGWTSEASGATVVMSVTGVAATTIKWKVAVVSMETAL